MIRSELLQHSHVEISQTQLLFVKDMQCLPGCRKRTLMQLLKSEIGCYQCLAFPLGKSSGISVEILVQSQI